MTAGLKYNSSRADLLPFLPNTCRVLLDVGCGSGGFGRLLRSHRPDMELWAVEPDLASVRAAGDGFDHVIHSEFPTDLLPNARFDVVMFADVLEHMVEPENALRATVKALAQGGIVVASIPNVRHWRAVVWPLMRHGAWTYTETGILDRTHLRFFTRRSMCDFFTNNGWSVESVTGINITPRGKQFSALSVHRFDEFLYKQYVVVARPC
jgi:2-polyprenyl-3-methyl-5-hydroxy-6-metoxy-1,4-benzoquinol methylase